MKKCVFFILIALTFLSCTKTKLVINEAKEPVTSTSVAQKAEEVVKPKEDVEPDIYEHVQTLEFEGSGYETKVFKAPLEDEVIYTVQKGDKIDISSVIEYKATQKTYIKVKTPAGETGYVQIRWNPYQNGEYSYLETIVVDGVDIKILRITQHFEVSDGIFIKAFPSENSENLHEITHAEGAEVYEAMAITSDYEWVKIKLNEYVGWVPGNCLSVGRGGPTIETPEAVISFDLIGSNEI